MKKEKIILGTFFIIWFLLTIFFGKIVISIVFLGVFAGIIFSSDSEFFSDPDMEKMIGGLCFIAVFLGNVVYVLVAGFFPESSWQHTEFTFWGGVGYIAGLTALNAPFNFWVFSGD